MWDPKMYIMFLIIHIKTQNGFPTNGVTTGCHLHLTIKKDGIAVNPLNYFQK